MLAVITLTVIAFNDTPADGTLQARFDELGGSIGRAATNQLVLPDPERMVSRLHYADPLELFDYCKRNFSAAVALLHDYGLYEFTIIVRKGDAVQ